MNENRSLAPCAFLTAPSLIEASLHECHSDEPIVLTCVGEHHETAVAIHMSPECALRIIAELQRATMGAGVCADCGIYKPLSGDIHCIDCDKKLERAHEEEER